MLLEKSGISNQRIRATAKTAVVRNSGEGFFALRCHPRRIHRGGGWQNYGQQRTTGNNPRFAGFPTSRTKEGKLVVPTGDRLGAVKQAGGVGGRGVKEREEGWKIYRERGEREEEREREDGKD